MEPTSTRHAYGLGESDSLASEEKDPYSQVQAEWNEPRYLRGGSTNSQVNARAAFNRRLERSAQAAARHAGSLASLAARFPEDHPSALKYAVMKGEAKKLPVGENPWKGRFRDDSLPTVQPVMGSANNSADLSEDPKLQRSNSSPRYVRKIDGTTLLTDNSYGRSFESQDAGESEGPSHYKTVQGKSTMIGTRIEEDEEKEEVPNFSKRSTIEKEIIHPGFKVQDSHSVSDWDAYEGKVLSTKHSHPQQERLDDDQAKQNVWDSFPTIASDPMVFRDETSYQVADDEDFYSPRTSRQVIERDAIVSADQDNGLEFEPYHDAGASPGKYFASRSAPMSSWPISDTTSHFRLDCTVGTLVSRSIRLSNGSRASQTLNLDCIGKGLTGNACYVFPHRVLLKPGEVKDVEIALFASQAAVDDTFIIRVKDQTNHQERRFRITARVRAGHVKVAKSTALVASVKMIDFGSCVDVIAGESFELKVKNVHPSETIGIQLFIKRQKNPRSFQAHFRSAKDETLDPGQEATVIVSLLPNPSNRIPFHYSASLFIRAKILLSGAVVDYCIPLTGATSSNKT